MADSKTRIKDFISNNFPAWKKVDYTEFKEEVNFDKKMSELYKIDNDEVILISYTNISITGSDRPKPQLRVFLQEYKNPFYFAKKHQLRYYLFSIFTKEDDMARGLNNFNPKDYIISIETNLDNENSRRDLRSIYDYANTHLKGNKFLKCTRANYSVDINQASLIYIGSPENPETETFEAFIKIFDSRPYQNSINRYRSPLTSENDKIIKSQTNILTAIHTKPFLIFGGFSGTGKTQKVKELAYLTCPTELQGEKSPGNYALISVKPNWHDSTELLGYESTIANKYMVTDFMRFVIKAMQYPNTPFFCCMDEMNLAPVEEYFAEYLSVLESRKKVQDIEGNWHIVSEPLLSADVFKKTYKGTSEPGAKYNIFEDLGLEKVGRTVSTHEISSVGAGTDVSTEAFDREDIITILKRDGLCIPENLIVIGTVNMDDTTNSFSRKVIDRAMIFETDIETFSKEAYFGADDTLQYGNVDGKPFIADEVRADKAIEAGYELSEEDRQAIIDYINEMNKAMAGTSFQISYRVLNETILYYRSMQLLNEGQASLDQVKNDILMMKVLPRIEGDSAAKKALVGLKIMIEKNVPDEWVNVPYDIDPDAIASKTPTPWKDSILKIEYMLNLLNTGDGFTRFWK